MNINAPEILVLLVAALFIFGPDRLPGMISQTVNTIRQLRDLANSARSDLTSAIGPELRELNINAGLEELRGLRDLHPRRMVNDAINGKLFEPGQNGSTSNGSPSNGSTPHSSTSNGSVSTGSASNGHTAQGSSGVAAQPAPLPSVDPDAT